MQLTTVVPGRLYAVEQAVPEALAHAVLAVNWTEEPYTIMGGEAAVHRRRRIDPAPPVTADFEQYIRHTIVPEIELTCEIKFDHPEQAFVQWWLDEPGFRAVVHHDGPLPSSMQLYWTQQNQDLGTTFYHDRSATQLIQQFASRPNSGYLMLNQQPEQLLWHDMQQAVPAGTVRLSSYIWFGPYSTRTV
jgi:hypothetical protein